MKNLVTNELKSDDLLLTATLWFANIDVSGFADYAVKAIIGGLVWFGFKLATDYFGARIKNRFRPKEPKDQDKKGASK